MDHSDSSSSLMSWQSLLESRAAIPRVIGFLRDIVVAIVWPPVSELRFLFPCRITTCCPRCTGWLSSLLPPADVVEAAAGPFSPACINRREELEAMPEFDVSLLSSLRIKGDCCTVGLTSAEGPCLASVGAIEACEPSCRVAGDCRTSLQPGLLLAPWTGPLFRLISPPSGCTFGSMRRLMDSCWSCNADGTSTGSGGAGKVEGSCGICCTCLGAALCFAARPGFLPGPAPFSFLAAPGAVPAVFFAVTVGDVGDFRPPSGAYGEV